MHEQVQYKLSYAGIWESDWHAEDLLLKENAYFVASYWERKGVISICNVKDESLKYEDVDDYSPAKEGSSLNDIMAPVSKCNVLCKKLDITKIVAKHGFMITVPDSVIEDTQPVKSIGGLNMCWICGKLLRGSIAELKLHIVGIHSREKPYRCRICQKSFKRRCSLREHEMVHTGSGQHKCLVCEKSFTNSSKLKLHLQIHSGKRPHKCEVCGNSFIYFIHLKRHKMIHSNEKPYKCEVCGMSFARSEGRRAHEFIHSGKQPYVCGVCGKSFARPGNLKVHETIHSGKRAYKCGLCSKTFKRGYHLKTHKLTHSGEKTHEMKGNEMK